MPELPINGRHAGRLGSKPDIYPQLPVTTPERGTDWRARRDRLADCQRIEENITQLRRALKSETQFNRQVELNMRIKGLEKELVATVRKL